MAVYKSFIIIIIINNINIIHVTLNIFVSRHTNKMDQYCHLCDIGLRATM